MKYDHSSVSLDLDILDKLIDSLGISSLSKSKRLVLKEIICS